MVHIFDIDHTVIDRSGAWHFLREALGDGVIRFSQISRLPLDWIRYKLRSPDMDFIESTVKKLAGLKQSELARISSLAFERSVKADIFTGAEKLIREIQQKNEKIIFATSSLDIIIKPLELFFGIEGSLSSELEFSDGITTGNLVGNSLFGGKKKAAVKTWIEKNNLDPKTDISFYSDSYTDLPLLEYCGNPVAVNPDSTLTKAAKKHGWEIIRFREVLGKSK